jgi:AhpD family alkylhydroperoxidase
MTTPDRQDPLTFFLDKSDPSAWKAVGGLSAAAARAARDAGLDDRLIELVNLRVSQVNGCAYCLDVHVRKGAAAGLDAQRLGLLAAWHDAPDLFTDQERAALRLAEVVTTLPEGEERDAAMVITHGELTDAQFSAVQWLAIAMNVTNRVSILSHHPVRPRD